MVDALFEVELIVVAVRWQMWVLLMVRLFAGLWLLESALRSVAVRRWKMYCMMLVVGLRLLGGWGSGAVEWLLWGVWLVLVSMCCG